MGLRVFLLLPMLAALMGSILVQTTSLNGGNGTTVVFGGVNGGQVKGTNATSIVCQEASICQYTAGGTLPPNAVITCKYGGFGNQGAPCQLWNGCANVPQGAYCYYFLGFDPISTNIDAGTTLYTGSAGQVTKSQSASVSATFGAFSANGLLLGIGVIVTVASLAGIAVFGTGESAESVHIIFIAGFFLGLLGMLTAFEGYVTGSSTSAFVQMNVLLTGLGDAFYLLLMFLYVVGITGTVSRGGV